MLPSSDVFGPWELLDALKKDNQELGLIIDLTFTRRYYTLQDVPQSLMVIKIFTAGHEVPDDNTILSFKRAVHRYLIDMDGMAPAEAVECKWSCFPATLREFVYKCESSETPVVIYSVQLITGPRYRETELPGGPLLWSKEESQSTTLTRTTLNTPTYPALHCSPILLWEFLHQPLSIHTDGPPLTQTTGPGTNHHWTLSGPPPLPCRTEVELLYPSFHATSPTGHLCLMVTGQLRDKVGPQ
ncbi:hypothetical protein GOODEAATRI_027965 [Goodea atripinnis]|uniref:Uncharacterized protein n=1 Tax=Goodea atripinnis TaxID=208336 RepID=A0ABV0NE83_9TELE